MARTTPPAPTVRRRDGAKAELRSPQPAPAATRPGAVAIERTVVYGRLPVATRLELDRRILRRPLTRRALQQAARELELGKRYGVRVADVQVYAESLEALVRPYVAQIAVGALLQALPAEVREGLADAGSLLVWSRLVQQLTDPEAEPLKPADFAKLADFLRSADPRRTEPARSRPARRAAPRSTAPAKGDDRATADLRPDALAAMIRDVYGLSPQGAATEPTNPHAPPARKS
jgi:hypothetical protein